MARSRSLTALIILAACLAFAALFVFKAMNEMADFEVNFKAGGRLWNGETLYRTADEHYQFKYSPFSALVYLPFSGFPLPVAKAIWYALVLASIAVLIVVSAKLASRPGRNRVVTALLSGAILAKLFFRELELGQINALIAALLVAMIWILSKDSGGQGGGRCLGAGFLWGLATALKPYALIFFPYFVLKKKWRAVFCGLIFISLSLLVPTAFYGFRGNMIVLEEWASSLSRSTPALLTSQDNVSLLAGLTKWTGRPGISLAIYGITIAGLALVTYVLIRKGEKLDMALPADGALLLVLMPMISPLGWDYTFLSAILAVALVVDSFSFFPKVIRAFLAVNFLIIGLSIYDLLGRRLYAVFMALSVPTVCFLALAGSLAYLRLKGKR